MAEFARALEAVTFPARLGDVSLRYEPSMLIGETDRGARTWRPTVAWLVGVASALFAAACVLGDVGDWLGGVLVVVAAAGFAGAVWLERADARRRRFVANFATNTLRLDFTSVIVGQPRTLLVPFDDVRKVELETQADRQRCIVVEFAFADESLAEVLITNLHIDEVEVAERVVRLLHGAFGLGQPPPEAPMDLFEGARSPQSS